MVTDTFLPDVDAASTCESKLPSRHEALLHMTEFLDDWPSTQIAKLDSPVAVTVADVDGDGKDDVIICYNYGEDFINCDPNGGFIAWLQNPGRENLGAPWTCRYIGRWPAMHRLKAGFFTQR